MTVGDQRAVAGRVRIDSLKVKVEVHPLGTTNPLQWLTENLPVEPALLLAHSLDGVNWGRSVKGSLAISHDVAPELSPPLRLETLQQARLFSPTMEYFLWHDGQQWMLRIIWEDDTGNSVSAIDEDHLLWGIERESVVDGFSILADGEQGLRHVLPLSIHEPMFPNYRAALRVRHYLAEQPNGVQYIACSRLMNVELRNYEPEPAAR